MQLLPELNQGGVERGAVELNRELVKRGHRSTVISAGGSQSAQIEKDGGRHITLDVCSKNPFTVPTIVAALRRLLAELRRIFSTPAAAFRLGWHGSPIRS